MTDIQDSPERPSSFQHAFRISLNLTRRVIRRVIELEDAASRLEAVVPKPRVSVVPDAVSFQFSLRMLRRVIRRLIDESEHGRALPA